MILISHRLYQLSPDFNDFKLQKSTCVKFANISLKDASFCLKQRNDVVTIDIP